jgi:hypothetical protein
MAVVLSGIAEIVCEKLITQKKTKNQPVLHRSLWFAGWRS